MVMQVENETLFVGLRVEIFRWRSEVNGAEVKRIDTLPDWGLDLRSGGQAKPRVRWLTAQAAFAKLDADADGEAGLLLSTSEAEPGEGCGLR